MMRSFSKSETTNSPDSTYWAQHAQYAEPMLPVVPPDGGSWSRIRAPDVGSGEVDRMNYLGHQLSNSRVVKHEGQTIYYQLPPDNQSIPFQVALTGDVAARSSLSESHVYDESSLRETDVQSAASSAKIYLDERLAMIRGSETAPGLEGAYYPQRLSSFLDEIFGSSDNEHREEEEGKTSDSSASDSVSAITVDSFCDGKSTGGGCTSDFEFSNDSTYFQPAEILFNSPSRSNSQESLRGHGHVEIELKKKFLAEAGNSTGHNNSVSAPEETDDTRESFHSGILHPISGDIAGMFKRWGSKAENDSNDQHSKVTSRAVGQEETETQPNETEDNALDRQTVSLPSLYDLSDQYVEDLRTSLTPQRRACQLICRPGRISRARAEAHQEEQEQLQRAVEVSRRRKHFSSFSRAADKRTVVVDGEIEQLTKEETLLLYAWRLSKTNKAMPDDQEGPPTATVNTSPRGQPIVGTNNDDEAAGANGQSDAESKAESNSSGSLAERNAAVLAATTSMLSLSSPKEKYAGGEMEREGSAILNKTNSSKSTTYTGQSIKEGTTERTAQPTVSGSNTVTTMGNRGETGAQNKTTGNLLRRRRSRTGILKRRYRQESTTADEQQETGSVTTTPPFSQGLDGNQTSSVVQGESGQTKETSRSIRSFNGLGATSTRRDDSYHMFAYSKREEEHKTTQIVEPTMQEKSIPDYSVCGAHDFKLGGSNESQSVRVATSETSLSAQNMQSQGARTEKVSNQSREIGTPVRSWRGNVTNPLLRNSLQRSDSIGNIRDQCSYRSSNSRRFGEIIATTDSKRYIPL